MSATDTRSTRELFRAWRAGDGEAGQAMAQRFADWYYAIATSRLGESRGRGPCDTACAAFGQGIVNVTESRALVGWAHEIIAGEISKAGARATDGNESSSFTGNQAPKPLLQRARKVLPAEVALLEACYSPNSPESTVTALAGPLGGVPLGILKARYRIKKWLRDYASVPFEVAPDNPVLDRAPLPLYEANRMANPNEEAQFEQWMLTDLDLCKDIAEFAQFSIALRGGIPQGEADAPKAPPAAAAGHSKPETTQPTAPQPAGTQLMIFGGVAIVALLLFGLLALGALVYVMQ